MKVIAKRNMDDLGRIVLPSEVRTILGVSAGDCIVIAEDDGRIQLFAAVQSCKICGATEDVHESYGICKHCIEKIKAN